MEPPVQDGAPPEGGVVLEVKKHCERLCLLPLTPKMLKGIYNCLKRSQKKEIIILALCLGYNNR